MAPRTRRVSAVDGMVRFDKGILESQINEFLAKNNIQKTKDTEEVDGVVTVYVPPAENYVIPDEIYVWVRTS